MAICFILNLFPELAAAHYESNEVAKAEKYKIFRNETLPFFLDKFEAIAKENDGHFALKKLTYADVFFTGLITYLGYMAEQDILEGRPYLTKVVENTKAAPGIKEWVAKRPKSER
jgi:prostaglandin-H2 D-isomerase / glutathione transferase